MPACPPSHQSRAVDGELLAEAARNKLHIFQMPVIYQPRKHGVSHFDSIRAATYTFEEIWAYWRRRQVVAALLGVALLGERVHAALVDQEAAERVEHVPTDVIGLAEQRVAWA